MLRNLSHTIFFYVYEITLLCGKTMNAPPPADSTIIAKNLGFTAQKVESQLLFDTLILS